MSQIGIKLSLSLRLLQVEDRTNFLWPFFFFMRNTLCNVGRSEI